MFDDILRALKDRLLLRVALLAGQVLSPNQITCLSFIAGLVCVYQASQGHSYTALLWWGINRLLDGLDGAVARATKMQTPFGGYLDIIMDFTIYALVPIAVVYHNTVGACIDSFEAASLESPSDAVATLRCSLVIVDPDGPSTRWSGLFWEWFVLALLEGVFFVNAASLFMLGSILEQLQRKGLANESANGKARKLTTVTMPRGLIEGFETVVGFSLFLLLPQHTLPLYATFFTLVGINVVHRLAWARAMISP